ncbi:VOC family protein [Myxococcota bacterium]|nr:VOC family protein [Myxococcota bacterium]
MSILAVSHLAICVSDLEASRTFYRDLLGFREVSELETRGSPTQDLLELENLDMHCIFVERDGLRIELMHMKSPGSHPQSEPIPMNRNGFTHIALRVDDFDATVSALESGGATILRQTEIANPAFQSRVIYILDPNGARIELIEAPGNPRAAVGTPIAS